MATVNVTVAHTKVNNALVKVEAGEVNVRPTSETASTTKMALMSTENISSVNRVKYLTRFDAEVTEHTNKMREVHRPVHAYRGKKGTPMPLASWTNVATKARTGPVDPMIVRG